MDEQEKKLGALMEKMRAKNDELNLVNAEVRNWEAEAHRLKKLWEEPYAVYRKAYDASLAYGNTIEPLQKQLIEIRSEIQQLHEEMLTTCIDYLLGPRHPHERGDKHD